MNSKYIITFIRTDKKNAAKAIAKVIYASTVAAKIAKMIIPGVSIIPNNGIKFPIILDLTLSFHFPAKTTNRNQSAINNSGKGTTSPFGGIHLVLSSFKTLPPSHALIVGTHASWLELGS